MKRGARFRTGGRSGRWEVQLRGGRSRVTPCAPASERPLALSSSLRCKSELQILMRGKYRSGGARPARSRPPPAPGCVRSHGDAGEGPAPPHPAGPVHPAVPAGVQGMAAPPHLPPPGPVCPDVTPSGRSRLPVCEQTGPRSRVARATARGVPGARRWGCRGAQGGARTSAPPGASRLAAETPTGRHARPSAGFRRGGDAAASRPGKPGGNGELPGRGRAGPPPHPLLLSPDPGARWGAAGRSPEWGKRELGRLSAGSRPFHLRWPSKSSSDFSQAAVAHQRRCLFGFLKRRTNEQRRKAGGRGGVGRRRGKERGTLSFQQIFSGGRQLRDPPFYQS